MSTQQTSTPTPHDLGTPPPLPLPGTGGQEEISSSDTGGAAHQERSPAPHHGVVCGGGFGTRLGKYVVGIGLLVAIWAISGGGSFWPMWAIIGWGFFVVFGGGSHHGSRQHPRAVREGR